MRARTKKKAKRMKAWHGWVAWYKSSDYTSRVYHTERAMAAAHGRGYYTPVRVLVTQARKGRGK